MAIGYMLFAILECPLAYYNLHLWVNLQEAKLLLTESYRREFAVEIYRGTLESYGVKHIEEFVYAPA